jgi:hypothetical protein
MREALLLFLSAVRRRCQLQAASRAIVIGTVAASLVCVAMMALRPSRERASLALAVVITGPVVGAAAGLARRPSWFRAAALVDEHYGLKDGTTSALEFSADPISGPFTILQVVRATRRLDQLSPAEIVPLTAPKGWPIAVGLLAIAVGFLSWPLVWAPVRAGDPVPVPFGPAVDEARRLEEHVRELEAIAREMPDPALDAMIERFRQTIAELKQPGLDARETMAKLSAHEAALDAQRRELNVAAADQELRSLGEALGEAAPLEPAGQSLRDARFDQAADQLEQAGDARIEEREALAVERSATRVGKEMRSKGLEQLGEATLKMAAGVKRGGESQKSGVKGLAKEVRDHERRRRINQLMAQEQRRLQECKDRIEKRNLMEQMAKEEQAKSQGSSSSSAKGTSDSSKKSNEPEKSARGGLERLKGIAGEGPSEVVDSRAIAGDGPRTARGPSPKKVQKYQKLSEAALESEPIPLGHRQSIRRYFELIREPAGPDVPPTEKGPEAPGP